MAQRKFMICLRLHRKLPAWIPLAAIPLPRSLRRRLIFLNASSVNKLSEYLIFLPLQQPLPLLARALGNHSSFIGCRVSKTVLQRTLPFWPWSGHVTQPRSMVSGVLNFEERFTRIEILILLKGGAWRGCYWLFYSATLLPIPLEIFFFSIYFYSPRYPNVLPTISTGLNWPGPDSVAC